MAEIQISCEVACQLCGWNTGCSIVTDEKNLFKEIIRFLSRCSSQHHSQGPQGKLLVTWEPLTAANQ